MRAVKKGLNMSAREASLFIKDGMTVGMSGWAMAGYPKAVVKALVQRKQEGEALAFSLITGANVPWLDEVLGREDMIVRRAPMLAGRELSTRANKGELSYVEEQMCRMPRLLRSGKLGSMDIALVEALGFDEEGLLIPSSSIGMTHHIMEGARGIIVEVNTAQPEGLRALHDVYIPEAPPRTRPIPLVRTNQRIGKKGLPLDHNRILAIVETSLPEEPGALPRDHALAGDMAGHLLNFLELEFQGRKEELPPLQTGFGSLADSIIKALGKSGFRDLEFFCGGITEPVLELWLQGKVQGISTGGLGMSSRVREILESSPGLEKDLVIRNGDITNSPEVAGRLGIVALNTGIEADIYGNVNASHIGGSRVVNGIGGGAGFARNAGLSLILIPSIAKGGAISGIVPMVSHQDIGSHDVDVMITENGVADLRGLDDRERAREIIAHCVHRDYRESLVRYLDEAERRFGGHHPQDPERAFDWYRRLREKGSMREDFV